LTTAAVQRRRLGDELSRIEHCEEKDPLTASAAQLRRFLHVIEHELLPTTKVEVARGRAVATDSAAVLDSQGRVVVAATSQEVACPLHRGAVVAIEQWAKCDQKPSMSEAIFLATHEPCCLCMTAIVHAGFQTCYYLFPRETARGQSALHDQRILHELWNVKQYRKRNALCSITGIVPLIDALRKTNEREAVDELHACIQRIKAAYDAISCDAEQATNRTNNALAVNLALHSGG
jgi:tRNA(Arg) A34 adenosine deaminase TadA